MFDAVKGGFKEPPSLYSSLSKCPDFEKYLEKIDIALEWSKKHPKFNNKFFIDVKESAIKYNNLTDKQKEAIDKIMNAWKMLD
jgi:hypothetical protein